MNFGTSTGTATIAQSRRIAACKEGVCIACYVWQQHADAPSGFSPVHGCDYHHMKSGNVRRGHEFGIGLCVWHHRKHPWEQWTVRETRAWFGPSLMDGGKVFAATYGSDDELLEVQDKLLGVLR